MSVYIWGYLRAKTCRLNIDIVSNAQDQGPDNKVLLHGSQGEKH